MSAFDRFSRLPPNPTRFIVTLTLAPELAGIVRPGALWLKGATVVDRQPSLDGPLAEAERTLRSRPDDLRRRVDLVRTMYKRVGIDPTKRRPSSEALLRRVLKGEPLPRINSLVDVCNWCSCEFQLPYGLYDSRRIDGDVTLRIGHAGETYPGIRKDDVHVGGRITLADATGPFGNPTSDSARTMVTSETSDVLLVVFAPVDVPPARLAEVLDVTARRMLRHTGATAEVVTLITSPEPRL